MKIGRLLVYIIPAFLISGDLLVPVAWLAAILFK